MVCPEHVLSFCDPFPSGSFRRSGFCPGLLEQEGRGKGLAWILGYAPWVLPVSCFVATVTSLSFLSKNRELLALRASGFSSVRTKQTLSFVWGDPVFAMLASRELQGPESGFEQSVGKGHALGFLQDENRKREDLVFWGSSTRRHGGTGVHVYSYDENGSDSYRIRAETASRVGSDWIFENGRFLGFPSGKGLPVPNESGKGLNWEKPPAPWKSLIQGRSSPRINKRFSSLRLSLPSDDPRIHEPFCKKPASLSYDELTTVIENYPHQSSTTLYPYRLRKAQLAG